MSKDIRLRVDFLDHPKTMKLERRLGLQGVISLIRLWCFAAQNKPSGRLDGMDEEDIELAAKWSGDPGKFVETILSEKCKWLEERDGVFYLHDWEEHQAWIAHQEERQERARHAARAKYAKAKQKTSNDDTGSQQETSDRDAGSMRVASDPQTTSTAPSPTPSPTPTPFPTPSPVTSNLKPENKRSNKLETGDKYICADSGESDADVSASGPSPAEEKKPKPTTPKRKKPTDPRINYVLKEFYPERFEEVVGEKPVMSFAKCGNLLKQIFATLDKKHGPDESLEIVKECISYAIEQTQAGGSRFPYETLDLAVYLSSSGFNRILQDLRGFNGKPPPSALHPRTSHNLRVLEEVLEERRRKRDELEVEQ